MGTIIAACLMAGMMAGSPDTPAALKRCEFTRTEMAVQVSIIMYAPDEATAATVSKAAFDHIHQLNSILSDYDEESELRQLCSHSSRGNPVRVSDDLWHVLHHAVELSAQTEGAFDITIGPVVKLWRRARRLKELPSAEALKSALARVDYRAIQFHEENQSVELLKPNMLLDLGGVAKGYALEEAFKVIEKHGITRVMLHAGGDIVLADPPPDKPGWRIGIGQIDPQKPPRFYLSLSHAEIATSGDRFQYVEIGGKRYSHIIDPKTGLGLTRHCQATVVVPLGTQADGLASSICIMGPDKGLQMLEKIPGAAAYVIAVSAQTGNEETRQSSRWKSLPPAEKEIDADVVVYTATAGGATASVAAARQGAKVVLIEPGRHVGGMFSGGLAHSDVHGQENLIGGVAQEVYRRMAAHYGKQDVSDAYEFEPHVAEDTLKAMLAEAGVRVVYGERLDSVTKSGPRIVSLKTESGNTYAAKVYIDAGYEGDLMAKAGVKYTVGREGRETYHEWLAGRTELLPSQHQFVCPVSPWKDGQYLPFITPQAKLVPTGQGDGKFQAYCFRLCLTDRPENRIPVEKPENYDPEDYELLRRYLKAAGNKAPKVLHTTRLPNGKGDANSSGAVSTDLLGPNWEYPEASYARRQEIWQQYVRWTHGLLWFLQNDPSVPAQHSKDYRRWGLCKDEFVDTGGWPHQLYIREGRRMLGDYVLTQRDLEMQRTKADSVGMCGYNIDIREVQWVAVRTFRYPKAEDEVYTEGYVSQPVKPWQIPYRCLTPKAAECENLLVSVCASMSTVAYGGFRLEPDYMIAGHAAGSAAALAAQTKTTVQKVNYESLRRILQEQGLVLESSE